MPELNPYSGRGDARVWQKSVFSVSHGDERSLYTSFHRQHWNFFFLIWWSLGLSSLYVENLGDCSCLTLWVLSHQISTQLSGTVRHLEVIGSWLKGALIESYRRIYTSLWLISMTRGWSISTLTNYPRLSIAIPSHGKENSCPPNPTCLDRLCFGVDYHLS